MSSLIFIATLVAKTPIHLGGGDGDGIADKSLRRDTTGALLLAGTGIAGALRGLATRLAPGLGLPPCITLGSAGNGKSVCGCPVCRLFGEVRPDEETVDGGRASRLLFSHAVASLPDGAAVQVRDGVGIERTSRNSAASAAAKFDYEVLPTGTRFDFRVEWETGDKADKDHAVLLAACLSEWETGRLWLGGGSARGLGAFELVDLEVRRRDLSDADRLMDFLRSDTPWRSDPVEADWLPGQLQQAKKRRSKPPRQASVPPEGSATPDMASGAEITADIEGVLLQDFVALTLRLRFAEPMLINDPAMAVRTGYDHAPLVELSTDAKRLLLPGSSLRGVLRTQAERIARTLTTIAVEDRQGGASEFGRRCPACDPNIRPPNNAASAPLCSCASLARTLSQDDDDEVTEEQLCLGCQLFGSSLFGSRLRIEGGGIELPGDAATQIRDFLAIDRFTGGAKVHAKFDALVPRLSGEGAPSIQVRMYLENPAAWELGWLNLALRDLCEGMVGLGFGGAKGFGRVELDGGSFAHGRLGDWCGDLSLTEGRYRPGTGIFEERRFDFDDQRDRAVLAQGATVWLDAFRARLNGFQRDDAFRLTSDSYFGRDQQSGPGTEQLFPAEDAR